MDPRLRLFPSLHPAAGALQSGEGIRWRKLQTGPDGLLTAPAGFVAGDLRSTFRIP